MSGTIHNKPLTHIRDWTRAERLLANGVNGGLNRTHDIVRNLQQGVNPPVQVSSVVRAVPEEAASRAQNYSLWGVFDEYFQCNPFAADGSAITNVVVFVARPWKLRRSTFDGETINGILYTRLNAQQRRAHKVGTSAELDHVELITPRWNVNDMITAIVVPQTGVVRTVEGGGEVMLTLQDLNTAPHAYAFDRVASGG